MMEMIAVSILFIYLKNLSFVYTRMINDSGTLTNKKYAKKTSTENRVALS